MSEALKKLNPIRVGIWGLGRAGWGMHCPEMGRFSDEFEIVAGCDLEQDRLTMFSEKYPNARTYLDGEAFLADPNIEMVSVAVRSPQHVDYCLRALEAGKIVFQEKPIALTVSGAEKLAEAAKRYPGKLYLRHNRRFEACFNHVRDIMASGILGDVYEIKLCRHSYSFRNDWQTIIDCGGGQLNNWGPHILDHGLRLLESPLESVWSKLKLIAARGDAEDHLKIILTGKNGRVIDIEISGGVALPSPVYAVYGTRGSLISMNEKEIQLKYLDPQMPLPTDKAHPETPPVNASFGGTQEPKWVCETVATAPANGLTINDIYHVLYQSIREGKEYPVSMEEALQVVKLADMVKKQNPDFPIKDDEYGK